MDGDRRPTRTNEIAKTCPSRLPTPIRTTDHSSVHPGFRAVHGVNERASHPIRPIIHILTIYSIPHILSHSFHLSHCHLPVHTPKRNRGNTIPWPLTNAIGSSALYHHTPDATMHAHTRGGEGHASSRHELRIRRQSEELSVVGVRTRGQADSGFDLVGAAGDHLRLIRSKRGEVGGDDARTCPGRGLVIGR